MIPLAQAEGAMKNMISESLAGLLQQVQQRAELVDLGTLIFGGRPLVPPSKQTYRSATDASTDDEQSESDRDQESQQHDNSRHIRLEV